MHTAHRVVRLASEQRGVVRFRQSRPKLPSRDVHEARVVLKLTVVSYTSAGSRLSSYCACSQTAATSSCVRRDRGGCQMSVMER